ncbi:MAG: hypothetical protein IPM35_18595 [Myxococcales bacterium]|nr:hypothetical protein [Myxococcales bacterium]
MSGARSLFITLGSLALFASSAPLSAGHDELLIGQGSGSGGENTGSVASKAADQTLRAAEASRAGGTTLAAAAR